MTVISLVWSWNSLELIEFC